MMLWNFETFLTFLMLAAALSWAWLRWVVVPRQRRLGATSRHRLASLAELFPVLLAVWLVRSFVVQPYRVPSGSLEPTVLPGDFILVKQYAYGLRLPVTHTLLGWHRAPHRGDIALFRWPRDPNWVFVKRVVGLPGDTVTYREKHLWLQGKPLPTRPYVPTTPLPLPPGEVRQYTQENLLGVWHNLVTDPQRPVLINRTWHVPPAHYVMLGDNRDYSNDSRYWGLVPDDALIGQAACILLSWDAEAWHRHDWRHVIRWHRIGRSLQPHTT